MSMYKSRKMRTGLSKNNNKALEMQKNEAILSKQSN